MSDKNTNENTKHELLKQLHEQYAINNNANLGTVMTFVVTLIAVIGYFGYVYVNSNTMFAPLCGPLVNAGVYYANALLLVYIASVFILVVLVCLCYYQGVAQRKEQFIIHAIRRFYFNENYLDYVVKGDDKENSKIFPKWYHPYKEGPLKIVQGLYGELIKMFIAVFILLTVAVLLKFASILNICYYTIIIVCVLIFLCLCYCFNVYNSFCRTKEEYTSLKPTAINDEKKESVVKNTETKK